MMRKKLTLVLVYLLIVKNVFCNFAEDVFAKLFNITNAFINTPFVLINDFIKKPFEIKIAPSINITIMSLAYFMVFWLLVKHVVNKLLESNDIRKGEGESSPLGVRFIILRVIIAYGAIIYYKDVLKVINSFLSEMMTLGAVGNLTKFIDYEYYYTKILQTDMSIFLKSFLILISIFISIVIGFLILFVAATVCTLIIQVFLMELVMPIHMAGLGSPESEESTKSFLQKYVFLKMRIVQYALTMVVIGNITSSGGRDLIINIIKALFVTMDDKQVEKTADIIIIGFAMILLFAAITMLVAAPKIAKAAKSYLDEKKKLKQDRLEEARNNAEEENKQKKESKEKKLNIFNLKKKIKKEKVEKRNELLGEIRKKIAELLRIIRKNTKGQYTKETVKEKFLSIIINIKEMNFSLDELKALLNSTNKILIKLRVLVTKTRTLLKTKIEKEKLLRKEIERLEKDIKGIKRKIIEFDSLEKKKDLKSKMELDAMELLEKLSELKLKHKNVLKIEEIDKSEKELEKILEDKLRKSFGVHLEIMTKIVEKTINGSISMIKLEDEALSKAFGQTLEIKISKVNLQEIYKDKTTDSEKKQSDLFFYVKELENLKNQEIKKLEDEKNEIEEEIKRNGETEEKNRRIEIIENTIEEIKNSKLTKIEEKEMSLKEKTEKIVKKMKEKLEEEKEKSIKKLKELKELNTDIENPKKIEEMIEEINKKIKRLNIEETGKILESIDKNAENELIKKFMFIEISDINVEKLSKQNELESLIKIVEKTEDEKQKKELEKQIEKVRKEIKEIEEIKNSKLTKIEEKVKEVKEFKEIIENEPILVKLSIEKVNNKIEEVKKQYAEVEINVLEDMKKDIPENSIERRILEINILDKKQFISENENISEKEKIGIIYKKEKEIELLEDMIIEEQKKRLSPSELSVAKIEVINNRKDRELEMLNREKMIREQEIEKKVPELRKTEMGKMVRIYQEKVEKIKLSYKNLIENEKKETKTYKEERIENLAKTNNEIKEEIKKLKEIIREFEREKGLLMKNIEIKEATKEAIKKIEDNQKNANIELKRQEEIYKKNQKEIVLLNREIEKIEIKDRMHLQKLLKEEIKKENKNRELIEEIQLKLQLYSNSASNIEYEKKTLLRKQKTEEEKLRKAKEEVMKNKREIIKAKKMYERAAKNYENCYTFTQEMSGHINKQGRDGLLDDESERFSGNMSGLLDYDDSLL